MFPVQVHWVLNHAPLFGLVIGLAFFISGMKQSSDFALLAGARIFAAVGAVSIPIVASGWRSAHALVCSGMARYKRCGLTPARRHPYSRYPYRPGCTQRDRPDSVVRLWWGRFFSLSDSDTCSRDAGLGDGRRSEASSGIMNLDGHRKPPVILGYR